MTSTLSRDKPKDSKSSHQGEQAIPVEEAAVINDIRKKALARKIIEARKLSSRIQVLPDGSRVFLRFSRAQQIEHQILLISFTALALTGLLQRYSQSDIVGIGMQLLGGIETSRMIHHLSAIVFGLLAIYHFYQIMFTWFVNKKLGSMWPRFRDFTDLLQTILYNMGISKEKPLHDRFSIEEKIEYWALLWGTVLMGVTGLVQWFPAQSTAIFPGIIIPISRAAHSWEAVLAVLSVIVWHGYHTLVKEKNRSIFTGYMTEHEMQETHPLEYRRILNAQHYLQRINQKNAEIHQLENPEISQVESSTEDQSLKKTEETL